MAPNITKCIGNLTTFRLSLTLVRHDDNYCQVSCGCTLSFYKHLSVTIQRKIKIFTLTSALNKAVFKRNLGMSIDYFPKNMTYLFIYDCHHFFYNYRFSTRMALENSNWLSLWCTQCHMSYSVNLVNILSSRFLSSSLCIHTHTLTDSR